MNYRDAFLESNPDLLPPRKEESVEVDSLAKLAELDHDEIVKGYSEGWDNPSPPIGKSKSYMHGWLNAQVDRRRMEPSEASRKLAAEYVASMRR